MLLGSGRALPRALRRAGRARTAVLFGNHDRLLCRGRTPRGRWPAGARRRRHAPRRRRGERRGAVRDAEPREASQCLAGHAVLAARGRGRVSSVRVAPLAAATGARTIACDTLLVSGGWSPSVHAGLHEGGSGRFEPALGAFAAGDQPQWRIGCGAANGRLELAAVLADGHAAGAQRAARVAGCTRRGRGAAARRAATPRRDSSRSGVRRRRCGAEKRQFVDLQNDVTVADLRAALAEGFVDIEHVKRYTTLGIGTEQGRTERACSAPRSSPSCAASRCRRSGCSRTRPPYQPVTLRSLAGLHARRGAATRAAHAAARLAPGARRRARVDGLLDAAALLPRQRRRCLRRGHRRGARGCAATAASSTARRSARSRSPGADAAAFLDRLYLTRASTIKVGRSKYMVNLREDGMVLDDGLVLRLAADRFVATTSSGHAGHMLSHFEFWRDTEWGGRAVTVTDVTEAWAVIVVRGTGEPRRARRRCSATAWRRLARRPDAHGLRRRRVAAERRCGCCARAFPASSPIELHCRPAIAAAAVGGAGRRQGSSPTDSRRSTSCGSRRAISSAASCHGQTTPYDLGMEAQVALGNACVGRALLDRPAFHEPSRPRLVGVRAADGRAQFLGGAQLARAAAGADQRSATSPRRSTARRSASGSGSRCSRARRRRPAPGSSRATRCAARPRSRWWSRRRCISMPATHG